MRTRPHHHHHRIQLQHHKEEEEARSSISSSSRHHPSSGRMLLLRATAPFAYAKMEKVDADEARHWRARFLIHKALEGEGLARRRPPATARGGGGCRVVRIGVRLKRLRLAVRAIRLRVYRSVHKHLRRIAHGIGSPRS